MCSARVAWRTRFAGRLLPRGQEGGAMRRLLAAVVVCGVTLAATNAAASAPAILSGGGTGTFDRVHPGSQFGFAVVFGGGSVRGHFNCVMAGRSAVPGLRLMKV